MTSAFTFSDVGVGDAGVGARDGDIRTGDVDAGAGAEASAGDDTISATEDDPGASDAASGIGAGNANTIYGDPGASDDDAGIRDDGEEDVRPDRPGKSPMSRRGTLEWWMVAFLPMAKIGEEWVQIQYASSSLIVAWATLCELNRRSQ
jgi:hypothetical protein